MTWGLTWDNSVGECFHPAVDCSIMPTQTVSDTSKVQVTIKEYSRTSILKKFPVERNVLRWNRRLDWNAWFLQTILISTVLNTKFEKTHVILSWYAGNLNTNNLSCQMISAVFHPFCCVSNVGPCGKGKHSCSCDCTHPNTIFFESNYLNLM